MKKLLVLAVTAALSIPVFAHADTANTNFYGTINTALETVKTGNATNGEKFNGRTRFSSYSSNLGVKGSDEISTGLKGIYQIEIAPDMVGGTLSTTLRNTGVGLDGAYGKLIVGHWDTPFKTAAAFADPFYGVAGYMAGVWDYAMVTRQSNSINYWSPNLMGGTLQMYYSPKGKGQKDMDYHLGGALTYADGPMNAAFAYNVDNTADNSGKSTGMKAAIGYKFFDTTGLNLGWTRYGTKAKLDDKTYDKTSSILVSVAHKMADWTFRGAYAILGKTKGGVNDAGDLDENFEFDKSGAKQFSLGAGYALSKRTEVFGTVSKIVNDDAANRNFNINPVGTDATGFKDGADPQVIALGVKHTF